MSEIVFSVIVQTVIGVACTLAYSMLMRVKLRHFPAIAIGTVLTFLVFSIFDLLGCNLFLSNLIAAAVASLYSETMARILKAPVAIYSTPAIILLVPGGRLYYTMSALMQGNRAVMLAEGSAALQIAFGIAVGILAVSIGKSFFPKRKNN